MVWRWQRLRPAPPPETREKLIKEQQFELAKQTTEPEGMRDGQWVEDGIGITDRRDNTQYRVVVGRERSKPFIQHIEITRPAGKRIDNKFGEAIPWEELTNVATHVAEEISDLAPGDRWYLPPQFGIRGRGQMPDLDRLAERFGEVGRAVVIEEYGQDYGVSRATVDSWIRAARDEGLIPPARGRRGRPKKNTQQEGSNNDE